MSLYVPAELQRQVRIKFGNCCAYCRTAEHLTACTFEIEHIVPGSAGGETVAENLCLACPTCNRCKSNRQRAIDPATSAETPLFHPNNDRWDDHFAWSDDGVRLVARTAIARTTIAAFRMNRPPLLRIRRLWVVMQEHPPKLD